MKKLIALVAVVTMLFGIVGTASAYDVGMSIVVAPDLIQWGPGTSDYRAADIDSDISLTVSPANAFTTTVNINVFGPYGELTKWYNYTNSTTQQAWLRIPIIIDSVDPADYPNINTKTTSFVGQTGQLIQQGSVLTINGVNYPVGIIAGFTKDAVAYGPFEGGAGTEAYDVGGAGLGAAQNAIGVYYSVPLMQGGSSETLSISYTPNGVEVYKATINITYADSAASNNAIIVSKSGNNASYFNASFNSGLSVLAFDNVLKSGNMMHANVDYDIYNVTTDALIEEDVTFPTITMTARIQLRDTSGNPLPIRTQMLTTVDGTAAADVPTGGYQSSMQGYIAEDEATAINTAGFLFTAEDAAADTFSASTTTDDGVYSELDSNGSFTVTIRIIDNSSSIIDAELQRFLSVASAANNAITPYFNILESSDGVTNLNGHTIEGVENRVNYTYLDDVSQRVYTYSAMNMQSLAYDVQLNSLDRIQAPTLTIVGNSNELLPVGSQRQLTVTSTNNATDNIAQWSSTNTNVATVNSAGLVTAVADGTTYITVRYAVGGEFDTVAVTVGTAPVATVAPVTPTTTQYFVAVGSSSSLNVRSGASTSSARVGRLKRGETVNVYEIVDGWAKIDYNGSIAYVSSRYISQ